MMADANARTLDQVLRDIEAERERLVGAVEQLRSELGQVPANLRANFRSKLPVVAGGIAAAGFVLAGGVGAPIRYLARRGRHQKPRIGGWSLPKRD